MSRANWAGWASSVLLLLITGCTVSEFFGLVSVQNSPGGGERLVAGSLEAVSRSSQEGLRALGITAFATEEAGAIRIACATRRGEHFDLVLTRVPTEQGERTRIQVQWENGGDKEAGFQALGQLVLKAAPRPDAQP